MFDRLAALVGALPPFLMLWYAERFERRVREPHAHWRYRVLAAAGLAAVPMAWAERAAAVVLSETAEPRRTLYEAFIVAASIEEFGKVLCLYLLTRSDLAPRTRYGSFLYALHAAAGFAIVENVLMMLDAPNLLFFTVRFVLRAYMASPMHMLAGGVVGYVWARRRFDAGSIGLSGGLALAIAIHGGYNALLLAVERLPAGHEVAVVVCAITAIALPLGGVVFLRYLAGLLRADDERDGRPESVRKPAAVVAP
ncbi:MAG: PrsW family intrarane metalloprotease [Pseudomonadota bacterium]|jgi:RsiW-degrading membrane proteinase PrsW (M82 family)